MNDDAEIGDGTAAEFARAMARIYTRAQEEVGYRATYFRAMLAEHGPEETARRLVLSPTASEGFTTLWEKGRLDLTVEALVVQPRYQALFADEVFVAAEQRLDSYGGIR